MTTSSAHRDCLWVGARADNGAMWVYDPSIQHDDPGMIYAFCATREQMREYPKNQVKSMLKTEKSDVRHTAIEKYLKWYSAHGDSFVESDRRAKHDKREAEKAAFLQRHKEYLEGLGKPFTGTAEPLSKGSRKTHCYVCKEKLDSHFFVQCNSCNWLICHCGACGCGYDSELRSY